LRAHSISFGSDSQCLKPFFDTHCFFFKFYFCRTRSFPFWLLRSFFLTLSVVPFFCFAWPPFTQEGVASLWVLFGRLGKLTILDLFVLSRFVPCRFFSKSSFGFFSILRHPPVLFFFFWHEVSWPRIGCLPKFSFLRNPSLIQLGRQGLATP